MRCPVCEVALTMSERQGIEIDYCPKCRGVWLDRGELDKIIERSVPTRVVDDDDDERAVRPREPQMEYREKEYRGSDHDDYHRKKRKKGFLGELFDFD